MTTFEPAIALPRPISTGAALGDKGGNGLNDTDDMEENLHQELHAVEQDPSGRYSRYDVVLGRGAFKTVYKAFDESEGIEVAWNQVKVNDLVSSPAERERLFAEIRVLKQLKHRNIMSFFDSWLDQRALSVNFVTEYFTSGTLRQYRKKHKHMDNEVLKRWAWQILQGLVYLHAHDPPIIHRDLKCDNIFVNGASGTIKIGDLGLATLWRGITTPQSVLGTPEFMAPELYEEKYNEKVDVYSFGMCLLELATMEYPYAECRNAAQIYKKVTQGVHPAGIAKVEHPELRDFICMCIQHDPDKRPEARQLLKSPFFETIRNGKTSCPGVDKAMAERNQEEGSYLTTFNSDSQSRLLTISEIRGGPGSESQQRSPKEGVVPEQGTASPTGEEGRGQGQGQQGPPVAAGTEGGGGGGGGTGPKHGLLAHLGIRENGHAPQGSASQSRSGTPPPLPIASLERQASHLHSLLGGGEGGGGANQWSGRGEGGSPQISPTSVSAQLQPSISSEQEVSLDKQGYKAQHLQPHGYGALSMDGRRISSNGGGGGPPPGRGPSPPLSPQQSRTDQGPPQAHHHYSQQHQHQQGTQMHPPGQQGQQQQQQQHGHDHFLDRQHGNHEGREFAVHCKQVEASTYSFQLKLMEHEGTAKTIEFAFDSTEDTAECIASEMMEDLSLSAHEARLIAAKITEELSRMASTPSQPALPLYPPSRQSSPAPPSYPGSRSSQDYPLYPPPQPGHTNTQGAWPPQLPASSGSAEMGPASHSTNFPVQPAIPAGNGGKQGGGSPPVGGMAAVPVSRRASEGPPSMSPSPLPASNPQQQPLQQQQQQGSGTPKSSSQGGAVLHPPPPVSIPPSLITPQVSFNGTTPGSIANPATPSSQATGGAPAAPPSYNSAFARSGRESQKSGERSGAHTPTDQLGMIGKQMSIHNLIAAMREVHEEEERLMKTSSMRRSHTELNGQDSNRRQSGAGGGGGAALQSPGSGKDGTKASLIDLALSNQFDQQAAFSSGGYKL